MKNKNWLISLLIFLAAGVFVQCSKDDDVGDEAKGTLAVKITDAPTDDANVEGTFITIADIKIDGQSVEGFSKQTIEISAYRNGETKLLLNEEVEAKSYNSISLVLDYESDASGNAPGCYVLDSGNVKHSLATEGETRGEVTISKPFEVESNTESSLVVDFDIRRAVVREEDESTETEYQFTTEAELENALRVVTENKTGNISGKVNMLFASENETYVFVYHKGEFSSSVESQGQGTSDVLFANAVTSAKADSEGNYKLSFLEEGEYEIHVVSFSKMDGHSMFSGFLNAASTISGILLNSVSISSNTQLVLNIDVSGSI